MRKENQFSEFESHLEDRKRMASASLSAIERARTEAALNRCRSSPSKSSPISAIGSLDLLLMFGPWPQVAFERAASVLEQKSRVFGEK